MSKLKRKLAEKIARDLFTSGERRYSHLSLNDAEELGWCEKAVADRIEEHLMEKYEEPKPHEFKVGDWAQHDNHASFKVRSTYPKEDDRYIYGEDGQAWLASSLRHVPAPKEAKPDPFQGPHWDSVHTGRGNCFDVMRECILDLRDEFRRMRESK